MRTCQCSLLLLLICKTCLSQFGWQTLGLGRTFSHFFLAQGKHGFFKLFAGFILLEEFCWIALIKQTSVFFRVSEPSKKIKQRIWKKKRRACFCLLLTQHVFIWKSANFQLLKNLQYHFLFVLLYSTSDISCHIFNLRMQNVPHIVERRILFWELPVNAGLFFFLHWCWDEVVKTVWP